MMITVHLSDGRKITKDSDRLLFFRDGIRMPTSDDLQEGHILLNFAHVIDIRPADEIEKKHAEIHGW